VEEQMTFTWILNAVSLFAMTVGSILFFYSLWESPRSTERLMTAEEQKAHLKQRRLVAIGGVALSLWFVSQYVFEVLM
jgi:hypothetical protein